MVNDSEFVRLKEYVETLAGTRGAPKKPLSSVRRGELLAIAGRTLLSEQVTAAPTMDQHNALQMDVAAIHAALAQISNALGTAKML